MGDRYRLVAAMLEDPLNLVCVFRELKRRRLPKGYLTPAVLSKSGVWGFAEVQKCYAEYPVEEDLLYALLNDGKGYFVISPDESEVGPFDTFDQAVAQAVAIAEAEGYVVLTEIPWKGLSDYPMP